MSSRAFAAVLALALACSPAAPTLVSPESTPAPAETPRAIAPRAAAPQALADFCTNDPCPTFQVERAQLLTKCAFAYAGPCGSGFTITYPTYPQEVTRFYDERGALVAVKVHGNEHGTGYTFFGTPPVCESRAEKLCTR